MEYVLSIIGVPSFGLKRAFAPVVWFGQHLKDHFIPHERNNYHPHILGHRALGLFSGLLVTVKIATIILVTVGPILPAYSSAITPGNIISLTNASRTSFGLAALNENSMLDQAAQAKANDMLAKGYFAHVTPDGKTPWDFITAAGYNYISAGENLAVNFTEAENVETAWMNSPEHRANLLNKTFQDIGIGISEGQYQGHTAIFVVQEFGTPAEEQIALTDTPTKVQVQPVPSPSPVQTQAKTAPVAAAKPAAVTPTPVAQPTPTAVPVVQNAAVPATPLAINDASVQIGTDSATITVTTSDTAVKVLAQFGQDAIMLSPKSSTDWEGSVPLNQLTDTSAKVSVKAFDVSGNLVSKQLADFAPSAIANYNPVGNVAGASITVLGKTFDPKALEGRFYLFFLAGLLSSLILAIGIRRHIQHLSLIVNTSFVAIFACLLFMAR